MELEDPYALRPMTGASEGGALEIEGFDDDFEEDNFLGEEMQVGVTSSSMTSGRVRDSGGIFVARLLHTNLVNVAERRDAAVWIRGGCFERAC